MKKIILMVLLLLIFSTCFAEDIITLEGNYEFTDAYIIPPYSHAIENQRVLEEFIDDNIKIELEIENKSDYWMEYTSNYYVFYVKKYQYEPDTTFVKTIDDGEIHIVKIEELWKLKESVEFRSIKKAVRIFNKWSKQ